MKKILLLASVMAMGVGINAQTMIAENFDAYTAGDYLGTQSDNFTTWTDSPGTAEDAYIIDSVTTISGNNCFVITSGSQDVVANLGTWTKGTFEVTFKYMVGVGAGAYFNFQKTETPGDQWAGEFYFNDDSTGYLTYQSVDYPFAFNNGEWTDVRAVISLDQDTAMVYINNVMVHGYQWSPDGGPNGNDPMNSLGMINFYGASPNSLPIEYYVDDVTFTRIPAMSVLNETFENGMPDMYVAEHVGGPWTTWTNSPGTGEDAYVTNSNPKDGLNSLHLDDPATDLIYEFGNLTAGRYELSFDLYLDAGAGAYYNLMHEFDSDYATQMYFNGDGTGNVEAGGEDIAFDYNDGDWNRIEYIIDLDNDNAKFFLNGNKIIDWQWSLDVFSGDGLNQLGVMDIFPAGSPVAAPGYYMDNINMQELVGMGTMDIEVEDFAAFYDAEYFALGNPGWSTWGGAIGTTEDIMISDTMSFSDENSLELLGGVGSDLIYRFGDLTSGSIEIGMKMYVPSGGNGYFNLMHDFDAAQEWAFEAYFNEDGTGLINAGGADAAPWTYI